LSIYVKHAARRICVIDQVSHPYALSLFFLNNPSENRFNPFISRDFISYAFFSHQLGFKGSHSNGRQHFNYIFYWSTAVIKLIEKGCSTTRPNSSRSFMMVSTANACIRYNDQLESKIRIFQRIPALKGVKSATTFSYYSKRSVAQF
jgi:hypothetical protein